MTKPTRRPVAPLLLPLRTLEAVAGGDTAPTRDLCTGQATGKRQHEPMYL